jgi:superfamily II DNA/RNA helicase
MGRKGREDGVHRLLRAILVACDAVIGVDICAKEDNRRMTDTSLWISRRSSCGHKSKCRICRGHHGILHLGLDPMLQRAVADSGYTTMTPIQAKAIPIVLAGRDVMGAAQTGTGKTAAFSLPLLQKMLRTRTAVSPARHPVRALVLAPTRELADQVANNIKTYAKHTKLRVAVVFGGIDMKPQTLELKAGVEVLIATPGRLLDHIEAKNCVLNQVEYVVLDEADRMLDIGFLPDLQRILSYLPKQRQTLLFSATFSPEIKRLAESYLQDPSWSRWPAPTPRPPTWSSASTASPPTTSARP